MADRLSPSFGCNGDQAPTKDGLEACPDNNNNGLDGIVRVPCSNKSHQEKLQGSDVAQAVSEEGEENGKPGMEAADEEDAEEEVAEEQVAEVDVAEVEVAEVEVAEEEVAEEEDAEEEVADDEVADEEVADEEVADEEVAEEEVVEEEVAEEEVAEEEDAEEEVAEEEVVEEEVAEEEVAEEEVAEEEVAEEEVAEEEDAEEEVAEVEVAAEEAAEEDNACVDEEEPNEDGSSLAAFRQDMLSAHNVFRAHHDAPMLIGCSELDERAQAWAEKLAEKDGNLAYEGTADEGENLSVNLWRSSTYRGWVPVNLWYKEAANYMFQGQPAAKNTVAVTRHFTQMVWRGTEKAGFGRAVSSSERVFAVAKYTPAGNCEGEFDANVLLPKGGKLMPALNQDQE